jgi:hypothetical protein
VTACRVVLKAPGHYEINIHLALPNGREVNIDRTATPTRGSQTFHSP